MNAANNAPTFVVGPNQTVNEDAGPQSVSPWATAIDDGDPESTQALTFNITGNTDPTLFSAGPSVSPSGVLTYTPAPNAFGSATIMLVLQDNGGTASGGVDTSGPQSFTITVDNVNDAPSFTKGADPTVNEDAGPQTVSPWAAAIDDGDPGVTQTLTFNVTGNTNPSLFSAGPSVSPTGVLTYTPAANASGTANITLSLSDDGGITNGGDDTSDAQSFTITVTALNDAPSFIAGPDQSVNEDASAQTVSPWATAIDDGDPESTQALTFNITGNTNSGLFSAGPSVSPSGILTYTPAANAFGSATITLVLKDDGGTAGGGADTSPPQSFTITINAVNDAPSFTGGGDRTVFEDAGAQSGAWATAISPGPANESGQTVSFSVINNNNALFSAQPAVLPSGTLTFTPAPNTNGSATVMVTLQDSGGTLNGGVNSFGPLSFTITVNPVNDPPSVTPPAAYPAHAHIAINIPDGATDLFDGSTITDVDGAGAAPFSITATGPFASTNGGSVTIAGNGSFSYNPPAGFTDANDDFTYQICDSGVPGSACTNATATVTVSGPRVWFVDNTAAAGGADGRLSNPFNTLTAADTAASASGDRTFVYTSASTYTLGFGLLLNQRLIGQGVVDTNFDTALGITPPATSVARPLINGTRPTINGTVTLATGGTARGFNVSHTTVTGVSGSGATGVTVNQVSVTTTTGTAVSLTSSGGTVSFTSVSSNGGTNGILLNNTTGSFTVTGTGTAGTGGTIQNKATGISLTTASNVSLTHMQLNDFTDFAIRGSSVVGFTMDNTVINGTNGNDAGADEGSVRFTELTGSAAISNSSVSGTVENNFTVINTTGTLNRITFDERDLRLDVRGDGRPRLVDRVNEYRRHQFHGPEQHLHRRARHPHQSRPEQLVGVGHRVHGQHHLQYRRHSRVRGRRRDPPVRRQQRRFKSLRHLQHREQHDARLPRCGARRQQDGRLGHFQRHNHRQHRRRRRRGELGIVRRLRHPGSDRRPRGEHLHGGDNGKHCPSIRQLRHPGNYGRQRRHRRGDHECHGNRQHRIQSRDAGLPQERYSPQQRSHGWRHLSGMLIARWRGGLGQRDHRHRHGRQRGLSDSATPILDSAAAWVWRCEQRRRRSGRLCTGEQRSGQHTYRQRGEHSPDGWRLRWGCGLPAAAVARKAVCGERVGGTAIRSWPPQAPPVRTPL